MNKLIKYFGWVPGYPAAFIIVGCMIVGAVVGAFSGLVNKGPK